MRRCTPFALRAIATTDRLAVYRPNVRVRVCVYICVSVFVRKYTIARGRLHDASGDLHTSWKSKSGPG